jgi:DNA-binding beta-propeller fold protein YncE
VRPDRVCGVLLVAALLAVPIAGRQHHLVPVYRVEAAWPKPLPNRWLVGAIAGVAVDTRDHVWIVHRPGTLQPNETRSIWRAAPPVLEFDPDGNLVAAWGGPGEGYEWPDLEHGIYVDHDSNVWLGGGGEKDAQVLKFTRQGRFLLQIGRKGQGSGSNDTRNLGAAANMTVDAAANELYVADGYVNHRVIVFDATTGAYKRHWGAYGEPPDDTLKFDPKTMLSGALPRFFSTPHGITGSNDGRIYVADRRGNRIQVFEQSGKFVSEKVIAPATLSSGSAFVPVLSKDPQQTWLYLADGTNHKIWILRRSTMEVVGEFGRGGRQLGQFLRPHGMSIDSKGNLYVGEASTGRRIQRFLVKGGR